MDKKNLLLKVFRGETKTSKATDLRKRWYIEAIYTHANGKPGRKLFYVSSRIKTTAEREKEIKKILQSFKDIDDITKVKPNQVKQHALLDALKSKHAYIGHKGRLDYAGKVNKFLTWINYKDVRLISYNDAMAFVNYLQEQKRNNTTINNYIGTLKILFTVLKRTGKIKKSPFDDVVSLKKVQCSLYRFTDEDIAKLKETILTSDEQLWLAVQMVYYCFIRPGSELRRLKISNINFAEGYINVSGAQSKNSKSQNVVIPAQFLQWLLEHGYDKYPGDYFVIGANGKPAPKVLGSNTLTRRHKVYLKKLGYSDNYSLYSWKHTGAWMAVKAGINLKELQMQLRHHSLDMVNEYLKNLGLHDMPNISAKFPSI